MGAIGRNSLPQRAKYKPALAPRLGEPQKNPRNLDFQSLARYVRQSGTSQFMSRLSPRFSAALLSAGIALFFAGCESDYSSQSSYLGGVYGENTETPRDSVSYWDGDGIPGKPSIKIRLSEQRAYFYKGKQLVGVSQLSTGREGLATPSGNFSVIQKDKDHVSSKYGDYVDSEDNVVVANVELGKDPKPPGTRFKGAPMPYFMRIVGGVGMHAGYLPGYPASHGCIRMPEFMAENFFNSVSQGTPVSISH